MQLHNTFGSISPVDYRYWDKDLAQYLSEDAFTRYKLKVELFLVLTLYRHGLCSSEVLAEIEAAIGAITTEEVYAEERRIGHDIRALVNCITKRMSDEAKPFVHMTATSYDIIDTANAARYRDVVIEIFVPALLKLEGVLIDLAIRESETLQIGRTHGQHAVPITFGFAIAGFVSRLGKCIEELQIRAGNLTGKFSGAVGAYNASALFFDDPEDFEAEILADLDLQPAECSTQIVPPEAMVRLLSEVITTCGVLADLANDMRQLTRTEISEVGEEFKAAQVGSSTMPHKRNPKNFEHIVSLWKIVAPRMTTAFMDQVNEHQRDLTNSASQRTYGEIIAYAVEMAECLFCTMSTLRVHHENMARNLETQKDTIISEPLYIILAALGCRDAHEKVRLFTLESERTGRSLMDVCASDPEMETYMTQLTPRQKELLADPILYTGIASKKTKAIAERWRKKLGI